MNRRVNRAIQQGNDAKWRYYYAQSIDRMTTSDGGFIVPPYLVAQLERHLGIAERQATDVDSRP